MTWEGFLAAFIPQLLATLVAGGLGVLAVWFAFKLQQGAAARDALDRAAESLLQRIGDYVDRLDAYRRETRTVTWAAGDFPKRQMPHPAGVSIAIISCGSSSPRTT